MLFQPALKNCSLFVTLGTLAREREGGEESESASSDLFALAGELFVRGDLQMQSSEEKRGSWFFFVVFPLFSLVFSFLGAAL